jgi:hypothetical protein
VLCYCLDSKSTTSSTDESSTSTISESARNRQPFSEGATKDGHSDSNGVERMAGSIQDSARESSYETLSSHRSFDWPADDEHSTKPSIAPTPEPTEPLATIDEEPEDETARKYVRPLSAVLRLGRKGASTDHSSVLFDCDISESDAVKGTLKMGTTNGHWYQLGPHKAVACPWLPPATTAEHPDAPGRKVAGKSIPSIEEAIRIVIRYLNDCSQWTVNLFMTDLFVFYSSHYKMMKDVPLVGWDVAFTPQGICLLEVQYVFAVESSTETYLLFVL